MKKTFKISIISIIMAGLLSFSPDCAFSMNFDFIKKKDSQKIESKKNKTPKTKKQKIKKEKYDDTVVKAKTDKNQPSVKILVKDDKTKSQKEPKIKQKKLNKPKAKNIKQQTEDTKDVNLQSDNTVNKEEIQIKNDDVFSADKPTIEASVSATHVISVDDCVKIALENNPSILSQLLSKDIYKNKIAQAWSNYFPTINAGLSASKNDMLMTNFKFPMQKYTLWNMPSLGVNQLIFDFGKTGIQAGVAKKTYEASRETLQASINDIVYQIGRAHV